MAFTFEQVDYQQEFGNSGDSVVTMTSTVTANNLLIALVGYVAADAPGGANDVDLPSGFVEEDTDTFASNRYYKIGYKIAAGGETSFTFPSTDTSWNGTCAVMELSGLDSTQGTVLGAKATDDNNSNGTDTTILSGTVTPSDSTGAIVAIHIGADSRDWRGTETVDNSFDLRLDIGTGSNYPLPFMSTLSNSSTTGKSTTLTTTDTGEAGSSDRKHGRIYHFKEAAAGGTSTYYNNFLHAQIGQ